LAQVGLGYLMCMQTLVHRAARGAVGMFSSELAFRSIKFDEASAREARHVLHVDASHGPHSLVSHGSHALLTELQQSITDLEVQTLHLWEDAVRKNMDYNLKHVQAKLATLKGEGSEEDAQCFASIERLAMQALSARLLVISAPMWNYGPPWVLKQYFDCILHPGLTFTEKENGPQGLLGGGRSLVILTSSGGSAGKDYLTPWLVDVAAMIGFDSSMVIAAPNAAHKERKLLVDEIEQTARQTAHNLQAILSQPFSTSNQQGSQVALGAPSTSPTRGQSQEDEGESPPEEWTDLELLHWLRAQGGLSEDALESLQAAKVDGQLWCHASEADWQSEELGLEESDVARIVELQEVLARKH